ncbi:hypothetical protein NLU13_9919 [Sarocladium strictum]|uniref:Zn(2)-C6 fungal-type domain-containing protein n=1 Tax=Sarocladium strictum TaxID=5046 RepID=A0AA39GA62_SARSR|nr:hypothetical protein NLU13_9919 [Sarocladium strictum]
MTPKDDAGPDGQITYPSPVAEAMDAGPYYTTTGREGDAAQEMHDAGNTHVTEHDEANLGHDPNHEQHHNGHHDQQDSRPANLEELQLAAQLGQGLTEAPMIAESEANMEDPNLRSILPHPEPEHQDQNTEQQPQPYMGPEPSAAEAMAPHGMPVPVPPQIPPHYSLPNDHVPPRKRSKVSRACDECRRKKIKCDATSDSGENPCTSCAKSNVRCLFSRVPQKRGPSKGYIKELADRINSIESKLQSEDGLGHEDLEKFFAQERQRSSTGPVDDASRKRPFSSISGNEFSTPTSNNRQAPWGSESRGPQPESFTNYTNASLAPQASPIKPDTTPSKQSVANMDIPMPDDEDVPEVGDNILHDYVTLIQPLYPVLPDDRSKLQSLLVQSPSPVRTGFLNAVMAIAQPAGGNAKLASSLLNDWENSENPRTPASNIVHAQALILLVIDADMRASATLPSLLARAVALANSMKLWKMADMAAAAEPDSDAQLCVRIWWSLVLLDRWHAAGTGKPMLIPDSSIVITAGLDAIVGESRYYLIRLSKVLGKVATTIASLPPSGTAEPMAATILSDYVENFREDLPSHINSSTFPLVHQAYWHARLLVTLLHPIISGTANRLLWPTSELITLLTSEPDIKTPLTHHFTSLLVLALTRLSQLDESKESALQLARDVVDQPGASVWDEVRERLARLTRPVSSVEAAASQGLQHLADLATAGQGGAADEETVPGQGSSSLALGYLDLV